MPRRVHNLRTQTVTHLLLRWLCVAAVVGSGCRMPGKGVGSVSERQLAETSRANELIRAVSYADAEELPGPTVSSTLASRSLPPPRIRDIESLAPWPMTLDDAVRIALENGSVVRGAGGRVLSFPDAARSPIDPAIAASDPNFGPEAALSAFDTQFQSSLLWNGGGRTIGSGPSFGAGGVFEQPRTMATLGFGKAFTAGTQVGITGVGGYDEQLADGAYAAFGARLRQPLARGAGSDVNHIAGPNAQPGAYRGVWIAQINEERSHLALERAVRDLVRDVSTAYWELYFAYENLQTKRAARDQAHRIWQREKLRLAEQVSPADAEALARQQFFAADAAVQNAVSGTGSETGVYAVEIQLRSLLGLPTSDGRIIRPADEPLNAEFVFDWFEALQIAQAQRIEVRRQHTKLRQAELELNAACNLSRPQVDLIGEYRRLAGDPNDNNALFSEALQGWQLGIEIERPFGNRRAKTAVRNAELRLRREQMLLIEQEHTISAELRRAMTELDRAFSVIQSLSVGREAAQIRLQAESQRHEAGDARIEDVLQSQVRSTQTETAYRRALVDYNLAFINLHYVRGTLMETLGVGFAAHADPEEILYARNATSVFGHANRTGQVADQRRRPQGLR